MQRRTLLASIGTLFVAGCTSPGGSDEDTPENTGTPAKAPEPDLSFDVEDGVVTIAHVGGDEVVDEETSKVAVTVDGERANVVYHGEEYAYWLADDGQLGEDEASAYTYPLSIGNTVNVEAEAGATVAVQWHGENGESEATLGEFTVPEATATETTENATETTENETTAETTDA